MPDKSNSPFQFWQELRRRKVVRVITVYAAAAFVLLELVDILADPLGLPGWSINLVLILLCVGLVITLILSWIYDITPEGVQKTKTINKATELPKEKPSKVTVWKIATYVSMVIIIGLLLANIFGSKKQEETRNELEKSIAVLPFNNLSEEKGNEHFVDGLVEDLLNRISVIEELKVISRTSSEMYRERGRKSVPEIASELGVSYILEGSVQRYGEKARITVQLIDAINDDHIWADNYDRDIVDVFKTQSEIAMQIASELNTILTSRQKTQIQENRTKNVKAFELYQMGRFYWNKRTGDDYNTSIEYFEKAIDEDPGYGLAYAGLADTYNLMALQGWIDEQEGRDKAVELALKALELDENLAEAYTVLGSIYDYVDWDWEKAESAFKRALELNPNYATAHHYYSEHLSITGRHEEARKHIDKALELNPLSFVIRHVSGAKLYYNRGRFKEALAEIQKCHELHENHPWLPRRDFHIYWQLGEEEKAYEALRKIFNADSIYNLETAEKIYKESGLKALIDWKITIDINSAESDSRAYSIANTYGMIGEDEKALEWLEKTYIFGRISPEMSFSIHFKNLHNNPRYIAILKKMGLAIQ
jgi:TolB-like protein